MTTIRIEIADKPSNSKGWARYSASSAGAQIIRSRTGNEWVSAPHTSDDVEPGTTIEIVTGVMLRVGKRKQEQYYSQTHDLIADSDATCEIEHKPGSQGLRLHITGARLAS